MPRNSANITGEIHISIVNLLLTSGLIHPYDLNAFISSFKVLQWIFFHFYLFCIEIPVSKQC